MKSKYFFTLLFISAISACNQKSAPEEKSEPTISKTEIVLSDDQYKNVGILLGHPTQHSLSETISMTGKLDVPPQNIVIITAPFGGFLRSTDLINGMFIKKGQQIALIENPEYILLQQEYKDTQSQISFLEMEFHRQEALAQENINAQKTLQKAKADWLSMKAKSMGSLAKLKMLDINPKDLNNDYFISTINLYSPISGYVTQVNAVIGSFVSPTQPIFKIVNTNHIHIELVAFERDLPKIKVGQTVVFTLLNEVVKRKAKVYLIGKEISTERTVMIHCHLENEDPSFIPGMYLKAEIKMGGKMPLTVLPEDALINFEGKDYIFVMQDENINKFKLIEIKRGISDADLVEVDIPKEIIDKNVPIVINGAYNLFGALRKNNENE